MLGVKNYSQEYIAACRSKVEADITVFKNLLTTARKHTDASLSDNLKSLEHAYFNNLILVLEGLFVHRIRAIEKKDGNPLNEVRVLSNSFMQNGGVVLSDKSIKLAPEKSILGYKEGDQIRIAEADFIRLSEAFFTEIEHKYIS